MRGGRRGGGTLREVCEGGLGGEEIFVEVFEGVGLGRRVRKREKKKKRKR